jgi:glutamine synthetase
LRVYADELQEQSDRVAYASHEIEGFLFRGCNAEQRYGDTGAFEFVSEGGYFHSLPQDLLRRFIDRTAEVHRALGFANEKDHPEVAPSQFELSYGYTPVLVAADQVQLYKLVCRQVAATMDLTASFLPKPVIGVNGNSMHTNLSVAEGGKNLFHDASGQEQLSRFGWDFVERILHAASELSLVLNSSVNSYRRLEPADGAPNQIKVSANNRGAMIRIPFADEQSARIEVRSVSPDANPYLLLYVLLRTGLEGDSPKTEEDKRPRTRFLPSNIYDALRQFKGSNQMAAFLGEEVHTRFVELKKAIADRSPRALGGRIKRSEILFHHEVTNQLLWSQF